MIRGIEYEQPDICSIFYFVVYSNAQFLSVRVEQNKKSTLFDDDSRYGIQQEFFRSIEMFLRSILLELLHEIFCS